MIGDRSLSMRLYYGAIYIVLVIIAFVCLLPLLHVLAVSFSSKAAASANFVKLWPVGFNVEAYKWIIHDKDFVRAMWISIQRTGIGTIFNIFLITMAAYPLSKDAKELKGRNFLIWLYIFPMLFYGGLIPTYMLLREIQLINKFWVLILPMFSFQIFNMIMMMNFFRSLPKGLYESARVDGAGHWTILLKIVLPLSLAPVASITLLSAVVHWNDFFFGLVYMTDRIKWPLQTFLFTQKLSIDVTRLSPQDVKNLSTISDRTLKAAQLFIGMVPILAFYPFLQKYFVGGLTVGSVKE